MKYRQAVVLVYCPKVKEIVSLAQCEACKHYAGLVESTVLCEWEEE